MKRFSLLLLPLVALLFVAPSWAADKDDDEVAKKLSEIAQLGPGVSNVKTDAKGRIRSCLIVGQARISTVLGTAKGLEVARDKARLDANTEFVKWLKSQVSVQLKSEVVTLTIQKGNEGDDKENVKETGESIEKTSKKMELISEGLVRGLQVVHAEQSGKDKMYTVVMAWSADTAKAVEGIEKGTDPKDNKPDGDAKKDDPKLDKKIDDKKSTSKDAKKFLD